MKQHSKGWYTVKTAGATFQLFYSPTPGFCGDIQDGVAFRESDRKGVFAVDYADLLEMARLAQELRGESRVCCECGVVSL